MIEAGLTTLLNETHAAFEQGRVFEGMARLTPELTRIHLDARSDYAHLVQRVLRPHPLAVHLQTDPFTKHAFTRPRGYPGDAGLIDLIYQPEVFPTGTPALGQQIARYSLNVPETVAVRERRAILASLVDETVHEHEHPEVLCVAAGHCRELALSQSAARGAFMGGGRFVAFDQDALSLAEIDREWSAHGVVTECASIRSIVSGAYSGGTFNLIYAAGLYDYLAERLAVRLTSRLFAMLKPGGRLVIGNFNTGGHSVGYMLAYMDWNLIYRSSDEMFALLGEVPRESLAHLRTFETSNRHVIFLDARKC